jgi:hypothetical protein
MREVGGETGKERLEGREKREFGAVAWITRRYFLTILTNQRLRITF